MALTPDQKKRLSALDDRAPQEEEAAGSGAKSFFGRLKSALFRARISVRRTPFLKLLLLCAVVVVGGYFIKSYQLHRIDFGKAISSGRGSLVTRLWSAVKAQKQKSDTLDMAHAHFLSGEYVKALEMILPIAQEDPEDKRAKMLIDLIADGAILRAAREFDSGQIKAALADLRLALRHRPEHKAAMDLSNRIAERLLREAQTHYSKKEYSQLITKAKEALRLKSDEMRALNLLMQANSELLTQADEFFITRRYADALKSTRQALMIDPDNARALGLLEEIRYYVEAPKLRVLGIIRLGRVTYARIQLPGTSRVKTMKKGDAEANFRVAKIDAAGRTVTFQQVYTKQKFTVALPKKN